MLRIAVLTELYSPSIGGQEAFFDGIARALVRRGHQVDVFCIGHTDAAPREETIGGVSVFRSPVDATYQQPRRVWMKRRWGTIARYALQTRRVALRGEHDFYILNQWPLLHLPALPRAARRRALTHWCEIREGRFYTVIQKWLPRLSRLNAAISEPVAEEVQRASGREVFVLPSGLDLERYVAPGEAGRSGILCVGRVAEHKNVPLLIDAFEILSERGYEGNLTIAGDGPDLPAVRLRVERSRVASRIALLGFVSDEKKVALLGAARMLAMPSRREGFPRVVAEAMASGLPVVTTDFPENGTQHIVAMSGSGIVTASDAELLARGMLAIDAAWPKYSAAGLSYASSLGWDEIAGRLETEIARVLETGGATRVSRQ